jgi:hypothetical protein
MEDINTMGKLLLNYAKTVEEKCRLCLLYRRTKIVHSAFWRTIECTPPVQSILAPTFVAARDTIVARLQK